MKDRYSLLGGIISFFLSGSRLASCGLEHLPEVGEIAEDVLFFTSQRTLGSPYSFLTRSETSPCGSMELKEGGREPDRTTGIWGGF